MTNKEELNGVVERFNKELSNTPYSIQIQGRNNYLCIDLFNGTSCEKMLSSFKTRKETINYIYALLTGISLTK